ncbi:MAG: pantoate--beta-alanine ligase [Chitinivibrionales bacterium]|nr:pantoate--beta-alanine ligase [Chitinivibrionales bacterium]
MDILKTPREMHALSVRLRASGKRIGLFPTLGALHEGHVSLLRRAREESDVCVMSLFVNPTQFGPNEDFEKYPRRFEQDCEIAAAQGCDVVFAPNREAMYPPGYSTFVEVERVTETLCGASRPGHFRGVATVVLKLFNIVAPDIATFGQKDAQQVLMLKRMLTDLNVPVEILVCPTVRERDGLALSSRNAYLTDEERVVAPALYQGLQALRERYDAGERGVPALKQAALDAYGKARLLRIEYLEAVDTTTVHPVDRVEGAVLVAVACRTSQSNTRLIDNITLGGEL